MEQLSKTGYSTEAIKSALVDIDSYKEIEKETRDKKKFQRLIEEIIKEKTILTHIFRETLKIKIGNWGNGQHGRIASYNFSAYRKTYLRCFNTATKLIEQEK
eukprot:TRINITY_DN7804_c0_g3_i1.p4 TRINITY_DN7804_c0_g3~~TRINITY_DN7804_c0_g3_i1.p4  ORF type:complete len:102 (+),score=21.06 TRINITY_DN7804_c0_g3_i1:587-892(+)